MLSWLAAELAPSELGAPEEKEPGGLGGIAAALLAVDGAAAGRRPLTSGWVRREPWSPVRAACSHTVAVRAWGGAGEGRLGRLGRCWGRGLGEPESWQLLPGVPGHGGARTG